MIQQQSWDALLAVGRETLATCLRNAAYYRSEHMRGGFAIHDNLAQEEELKAAALSAEIQALERLLAEGAKP
jgi:hypothetical protein